jgi:hypothetical protein
MAALDAAVLLTSCASDSLPARITSGERFAAVIQLPGGSHRQIGDEAHRTQFDWNARMEFRLPKRADGVLLLRVYASIPDYTTVVPATASTPAHDAETLDYGDRAFALEPNKHMRAREASEAEWMDGVVVERPNFRFGPHEWEPKGVPSNGAAEDVGGAFLFEGKKYPYHTAPGRFIVSPKRRWVAILSVKVGAVDLGQFFSPSYTYYLDIFDLNSGRLLSTAGGSVGVNGLPWISAVEEPSWVTDRYFYMPLSAEHDRLLMFDFGS